MNVERDKLLTGARLIEMAVAVIISGLISGSLTGMITMRVVESDLAHLRESHEDLKREFREMRSEIYRPAWENEGAMYPTDPETLLTDLRDSLHDAARYFPGKPETSEGTDDADPNHDLRRLLFIASADLADKRARTLLGEIELQAGQARYTDLPDDLIYIQTPIWGHDQRIQPWADDHPGPLPRARIVRENGERVLVLSPAPTREQIHALGSSWRFYYAASYWNGEPADPIQLETPADRGLLLLRAQAEAMRELAMQNITRPVETRTSMAMPANATAGALYERLMAEYRERIEG